MLFAPGLRSDGRRDALNGVAMHEVTAVEADSLVDRTGLKGTDL